VSAPRSDDVAHVPTGPVPASQEGQRLLDLVKVMARLRGPGGCPWDHEQTHATLARHLLEETHELLDAIDDDASDEIRDELGDLLLQVVFHAQISADEGRWDVDDVAQGLIAKLIHRHPHVFGDAEVSGADEVLTNWEKLKAEEGRAPRDGLDDGVPEALPALARAAKVQRRADAAGLAWPDAEAALEALGREAGGLESSPRDDLEDRIGAFLFVAVAAARAVGVDAESALRRATRRFVERSDLVVDRARARGVDPSSLSDDELRGLFGDVGA
jgi:tetrapyrrole methylase family protein / MazG family protein